MNKDLNKIPKIKQIGNYLLYETLGKGTFSKVKSGIHMRTGENIAAKILNTEKATDKEMERIKREINILKQMNHPNIIQLKDVITTTKNIYLIMEYIKGEDLYDYVIEKGKLSDIESCIIFKQLISCVEYINSLGISHRDIKPENILINKKSNKIKLIDFDLRNICSKDELLITKCGSPSFVSPEILQNKSYRGLYADILPMI